MAEIVELESAAASASLADKVFAHNLVDKFCKDRAMAEAIDLAVAGLAAEVNSEDLADSVRMLLSQHIDSLNEHIEELGSLRKSRSRKT